MAIACGTITVWKPANITAIYMTISTTDCDEPCESTIAVTWANVGGRTATIIPAITIDGVRTVGTSITLAKNESATQSFIVTGLMEGEYTVCPDPN